MVWPAGKFITRSAFIHRRFMRGRFMRGRFMRDRFMRVSGASGSGRPVCFGPQRPARPAPCPRVDRARETREHGAPLPGSTSRTLRRQRGLMGSLAASGRYRNHMGRFGVAALAVGIGTAIASTAAPAAADTGSDAAARPNSSEAAPGPVSARSNAGTSKRSESARIRSAAPARRQLLPPRA